MNSHEPLTAVERARIAYELMQEQQLEAARQRRSRGRVRNMRVAVILAGVLALLLATAVYKEWTPWRSSGSHAADGGAFGANRTGHVRSFVAGDTCRELEFNNTRGIYTDGKLAPCETVFKREGGSFPKGSRVDSIRDAFTSR